jgi:hypothetical protein
MAPTRRTEAPVPLVVVAKHLNIPPPNEARKAKRFLVKHGIPITRVGKEDRAMLSDVSAVKPRRTESVDKRFSDLRQLVRALMDRVEALETWRAEADRKLAG